MVSSQVNSKSDYCRCGWQASVRIKFLLSGFGVNANDVYLGPLLCRKDADCNRNVNLTTGMQIMHPMGFYGDVVTASTQSR